MTQRDKWIDSAKLDTLNIHIAKHKVVDRQDILTFLTLIDTNDANVIIQEIRAWLKDLHESDVYKNVRFTDSDINDIIGDLDSYGVVQSETILRFQDSSSRNLV
jgi:hypothetical protein